MTLGVHCANIIMAHDQKICYCHDYTIQFRQQLFNLQLCYTIFDLWDTRSTSGDCIMAIYSRTRNVRYNVLNITNSGRTACFPPFHTGLRVIQVLTRTLFSTQKYIYTPQTHKVAANNSKYKLVFYTL